MAATPRLQIDLSFSLVEPVQADPDAELPAGPHEVPESEVMTGTVSADGTEVTIFTSRPDMLLRGRSVKFADLRTIADEVASFGLSVTLSGPDGVIAKIGAVDVPLMQRFVTGSPNIRLGSPSALAPLMQRRGAPVTPIPLPPTTLFPLVPTVSRRIRRRATTTHSTPGSGRPRLIFVVGSENWDGKPPREFNLLPDGTTIGSGAEADLRLEGLNPVHAQIRHDDDDEYILYPIGDLAGFSTLLGTSTGRKDGGQVLRTGARIDLGPWKMAYFREEFADHGRPHGGRLGGEFARQKPQEDNRPGRKHRENDQK